MSSQRSGVGEAPQRVLGSAIGGLERNGAVGQRRADLHDRSPIPQAHALQSRHRAMHRPQVCDLGGALKLIRLDVPDSREDRGHGVVYPDFDRPQLGFDPRSRRFDLTGVCDVNRDHQGTASLTLDLPGRRLQPGVRPRQQTQMYTGLCEGPHRGSAHTSGGAGNDHNLAFHGPGHLPPALDGAGTQPNLAEDPRALTNASAAPFRRRTEPRRYRPQRPPPGRAGSRHPQQRRQEAQQEKGQADSHRQLTADRPGGVRKVRRSPHRSRAIARW